MKNPEPPPAHHPRGERASSGALRGHGTQGPVLRRAEILRFLLLVAAVGIGLSHSPELIGRCCHRLPNLVGLVAEICRIAV